MWTQHIRVRWWCPTPQQLHVLFILANDKSIQLVPKEKQRDTNSISYYYLYSANVPNHLLMYIIYLYIIIEKRRNILFSIEPYLV